ncbi:MAG: hypothetical protein JWO13_2307 [Acidobacteriales bacterium]|nr:hypothetical protein [Terriglobales bacterium]
MGRIVRLLLIVSAALAFVPSASAQNAVVLGTVLDAGGKPMVGVVVLLENKGRAFVRKTTTGADGTYTISGVEPADGYTVSATTQDGADIDATKQSFAVSVGDEREILPALREHPAPTVAGGEPSTGAAPSPAAPTGPARAASKVPNDKNTNIGGVITGAQLRTLPLYNRNFLVLGLLSPNTHDVEAGSPLSGASFSIAGQRASSNNFLLDGAENIASSSNQAIPFQVNDAIQEFRVTSSTANAEFGRGAGGIVSVISQSGTNKWHGSMFGYFANDALNMDSPLSVYNGSGFDKAATYAGSTSATPIASAGVGKAVGPLAYNSYVATAKANGYCTNSITASGPAFNPATCVANNQGKNDLFNPAAILAANDTKKSPFDSKQFGANIGGPLSINKKIFMFGSYEGTRIDNPNAIFERVPTAFDKSIVSTNAAHAADYLLAKNILNLLPTSNVVGVPGVLEFYKGTAPNYTNVHNALIRTDYKATDSLNFSLRYAGQLLNQLHDDTLPESATYPGNGALRKAQNQNAVFTITKSYKKLINEARLGITQFRFTETAQDASFNAKTIGLNGNALQTILLSGLDTQYSGAAPGKSGAYGGWLDSFWSTNAGAAPANQVATAGMLPTLDGLFPFARIGAPLDAPSLHRDTTWFGSDALSWSHGKHSFKFGGDFRFIQNRVTDGGFSRGYIASGDIGEFTSDSETCNTGKVSGVGCLTNPAFRAPSFDYALNQQPNFNGLFNSFSYAGFGQDQWKLGKRLTVNMGLRYEFFGVPHEVNDQIWNFDPTANGLVQQNGSKVFDPYGYQCTGAAVGTATTVDSVPRDRASAAQWQCLGASTNGNVIQPDLNDFAGRAGIAWDVRGDGRTVVRAGVGMFYDQSPISYMARLMENRPTQLNAANPRYIYGQTFLSGFCTQCGFGNSTVNPAYINPAVGGNGGYDAFRQSAASPFGLAARDNRNSKTPYTRQVNVTLQQSLGDYTSIELGYIGAGGHRLPIITNTGYNNEWFCNVSKIPVVAGGIVTGASNSVCDPFESFPIETQANVGSSLYHSALARLRVAQFKGLRVNATYTYSKSMDNASSANPNLVPTPLLTQASGLQRFGLANPFSFILTGGTALGVTIAQGANIPASVSGADTFTSSLTTTGAGRIFVSRYNLPQDPTNFRTNDWGPSDFDTTHRVVLDYNYELPLLRNSERWGGWQVSGILTVQSGQPFTIYSGPLFGESTERVSATGVQLTGDPNNYISGTFTLPGQALVGGSKCLFASAAPSTLLLTGPVGSPCIGNTTRNQFTGPAYASMDFAIQKGFKLFGSEAKELTFRTEAFNLLNRANYYNPISNYSLDGISTTNPDFGKVKSAHAPLQLQFSARFNF